MHRYRRLSVLILPLLILTIVGVAVTPLAQVALVSPGGQDSGFRQFVLPRLVALNEAVDTVESMVSDRSRNVIALQARADQIDTLTTQIDGYLAASDDYQVYSEVVDQYREGRDIVISAISDARTALRSFDFSSLPALVTMFAEGSDYLDEALALLVSMEQSRSSYTVRQAVRIRSSGQLRVGTCQKSAYANRLSIQWE